MKKLKDKLINAWLWFLSYNRFHTVMTSGNEDKVPEGYHRVPVQFRKGNTWGHYHPDNPVQYWTEDMVWENSSNSYRLRVEKSPTIVTVDEIPYTIPYKHGVIESKTTFKYGYFTAEILFPPEPGQWPAFWLYNGDDPTTSKIEYSEIDIVEGYSCTGDYQGYKKFQPNVHYKNDEGVWINTGSSDRFLINPTLRWIRFSLHWTEDFMKFYYNGYLVKIVTDKTVLNKMRDMILVCNSAVQLKYNPTNSYTSFRNINVYQKSNEEN